MRHKQQRLLEQNIQHLETYIKEHKLEDISPEDMILTITEADPDQANFKNSKWLIKNLLAKNFLWEDIESGKFSKAYDTLSRFLNIRKQWPESNLKDINQYTGLSGIAEKIRPFEITKGMNELKREEKARIYSETIVLFDGQHSKHEYLKDYLIVIPKTPEASCFWGRGTEWCTASTKSKNYFNHYNANGPLIICMTPDNRKYQFNQGSSPMDENDKPLNNIKNPLLAILALMTQQSHSVSKETMNKIFRVQELMNIIIPENPQILFHISNEQTKNILNKETCYQIIKNNPVYFYIIPDEMKTRDLVDMYIEQNKHLSFIEIPDRFWDKELCQKILKVDPNYIQDIIKQVTTKDSQMLVDIVKENGLNLAYLKKKDRNEELCNLAINQNGLALRYVPKEYITPEMYKIAVQNNGLALQHVPVELRSKELCQIAVQQNGMALSSVPRDLRTQELCNFAINQNGKALQFVPVLLKTEELCKLAIQNNGLALHSVPVALKTEEICKLAIQNNGLAISFLPPKIRNNNIYMLALENNIDVFNNIPPQFLTEDICKVAVKHKISLPGFLYNRLPQDLKDKFPQLQPIQKNQTSWMEERIYGKYEEIFNILQPQTPIKKIEIGY